MHASRQAAEITSSRWILHPLFVTPHFTSGRVREDCQERRKAQGVVDGSASDHSFPWFAVRGNEAHFECGISTRRAAEMFEQVLKRKEGISDVGFRPVQKYAPIRRSNNISWVQIKMA